MKYASKSEFKRANVFGTGILNVFMLKNMTGKNYMNPVKMAGRAMMLANVSFEPGARCFWHVHRGTTGGGQILVCTAGEGWYQEEGKDPVKLVPGSVQVIPTDVVHWHGAAADSWFSHIAVELGGEDVGNEFIRPVSEEEYAACAAFDTQSEEPWGSDFERANVFGKGAPNDMLAAHFTGNSYLNPLTPFPPEPGKPFLANVTFEPGCRNDWHVHRAAEGGGQVLVCTAGEGWYQEEGKRARALKPGSCVYVKPGVKHWHGAKADSWFSHISIEVPGASTATDWLEPVDADAYPSL